MSEDDSVIQEEKTWAELAILLKTNNEASEIKGTSIKSADSAMRIARRNLKKHGWQFITESKPGEGQVIIEAVPPEGFTVEDWIASQVRAVSRVREEQSAHWKKTEEALGRPVLTWREMAILGWSNVKAQNHRGSMNEVSAGRAMQLARAKLRSQGWTFDSRLIGSPPANEHTQDYLKEKADAQQKSNWYLRLPANSGLTRGR